MKKNAHEERIKNARLALDALVKAAASLTEPLTDQNLAFALVEASVAIVYIAKADQNEQARERAMQHVASVRLGAERLNTTQPVTSAEAKRVTRELNALLTDK